MKKCLPVLALLLALSVFAAVSTASPQPSAEAVAPTAAAPADAAVDLDLAELLGQPEAQPAGSCHGGTGGPCICPQVYEPVCGCDGRDYANSCLAACKVSSWTAGTCAGGGV